VLTLLEENKFYVNNVDDYNFVRHPPGHKLSELACERAHEMGVSFLSETEMERCVPLCGVKMPMRWVCRSSLRLRWNDVCPYVG
jgi:hypothetical protein